MHTCTSLERRSTVFRTFVVVQELYVLEVVGPEVESTSAAGLVNIIMAGVLNNEAQVQVTGEVDSQLDLSNVRNVDRVGWIATQSAGAIGIIGRHTCSAFEQGPHHGGRVARAVRHVSRCISVFFLATRITISRHDSLHRELAVP